MLLADTAEPVLAAPATRPTRSSPTPAVPASFLPRAPRRPVPILRAKSVHLADERIRLPDANTAGKRFGDVPLVRSRLHARDSVIEPIAAEQAARLSSATWTDGSAYSSSRPMIPTARVGSGQAYSASSSPSAARPKAAAGRPTAGLLCLAFTNVALAQATRPRCRISPSWIWRPRSSRSRRSVEA